MTGHTNIGLIQYLSPSLTKSKKVLSERLGPKARWRDFHSQIILKRNFDITYYLAYTNRTLSPGVV
jgi:hypothetical protein